MIKSITASYNIPPQYKPTFKAAVTKEMLGISPKVIMKELKITYPCYLQKLKDFNITSMQTTIRETKAEG